MSTFKVSFKIRGTVELRIIHDLGFLISGKLTAGGAL